MAREEGLAFQRLPSDTRQSEEEENLGRGAVSEWEIEDQVRIGSSSS